MPVIINEIEVIAPPPSREQQRDTNVTNMKPPGPTPADIYWVTRRLIERRLRLAAR